MLFCVSIITYIYLMLRIYPVILFNLYSLNSNFSLYYNLLCSRFYADFFFFKWIYQYIQLIFIYTIFYITSLLFTLECWFFKRIYRNLLSMLITKIIFQRTRTFLLKIVLFLNFILNMEAKYLLYTKRFILIMFCWTYKSIY